MIHWLDSMILGVFSKVKDYVACCEQVLVSRTLSSNPPLVLLLFA